MMEIIRGRIIEILTTVWRETPVATHVRNVQDAQETIAQHAKHVMHHPLVLWIAGMSVEVVRHGP